MTVEDPARAMLRSGVARRAWAFAWLCLAASACDSEGESSVDDDGVEPAPEGPIELDRRELSLGAGESRALRVTACCAYATILDAPELCENGATRFDPPHDAEPFTLRLLTSLVAADPPAEVELVVRLTQPELPTQSHTTGAVQVPTDASFEVPAYFDTAASFPCETPMEVELSRIDEADTRVDLSFAILVDDFHSVGFDGVTIED